MYIYIYYVYIHLHIHMIENLHSYIIYIYTVAYITYIYIRRALKALL